MNFLKTLIYAVPVFLLACGDNDKEEKQKQQVVHKEASSPVAQSPVTLTVDEFEGMKLFMRHCNKCHPGGEKGKGPSLNDKSVPNFLIHWQVRLGGGDMPKFTDEQISKAHLKQIVAFVSRMQDMTKDVDD